MVIESNAPDRHEGFTLVLDVGGIWPEIGEESIEVFPVLHDYWSNIAELHPG